MRHFIRWILASAALTILYAQGSKPPWTVILSSVLTAGVLALGLAWSNANWKQALAAVFVFLFAVTTTNMLEGVFFHVLTPWQLAAFLPGIILVSLVPAVILSFAPPVKREPGHAPATGSPGRLWARVPLLACAYVALYFAAGMIVWPYVKSFYQGRTLPASGLIIPVELLRALILVAAAWPWLRLIRSRAQAILFFGAAYSILGGIAPLLIPNPIMPAHIRLAHGFETGIENFIFGLLVGWLLTAKRVPAAVSHPAALRSDAA